MSQQHLQIHCGQISYDIMGNNGGNICNDFYSSYPASEYLPGVFGNVGIGGMIIGFVYFCSSAVTIAWIRKQQQNALMGMEGAAKHVVFPIYLPIMWVSALSDAFVGLVIFFVKVSTDGTTIWPNAIITAAALGIQHVVIEGIAVVLMQYGCGMRAMRIAGAAGGAIGLITFFAVLFYYRLGESSSASVIIYFCWMIGLLVFYSTLWLMPQKRLYRRPAVIFYAKFWTLFQLMVIVAVMVGALGPGVLPEATTVSTCIYNVIALPVFVVFKPFIMYSTLLMESKWWQGLLLFRAPPGDEGRSGRRSRGSDKSSRHPIRYISSVDGALDRLVSAQGEGGGEGEQRDLSRGTTGTDARESDGYSSVVDAPGGLFGTMGRILTDALRSLGLLSQGKSNSLSQYSDSSRQHGSDVSAAEDSGREAGAAGAGQEEGEADRDSTGDSSNRGSSSAGDLEDGSRPSEGTEGTEEGPGAGQPLLGASRERERSRRLPSERGRPAKQPGGTGIMAALSGAAKGLFSRRGRRGNQYDQLKGPLLGVEVGFSEAQELAMEVDNITHEGTVKLLNFAYLSLDRQGKKLLGTGSFSKVYAGKYRNHPVAVKMLFTQDLNPDVIKRCSNEARILTEISPHPNVVRVFGVAVLPPSVCLVLEICEYGSLSDVLRGSGDSGASVFRPPLNLSYSDRMYLALGCAKGVQALHAYSPLLCHRDIKSMNFLIDSQLNAKIADLDLGHQYDEDSTVEGARAGDGLQAGEGGRTRSGAGGGPVRVGGSNMCIYWQAPEVLLGQPYTQRSDVHSLALVIWEIISSGKTVKFYTKGGSKDSTAVVHGGLAGALRSQSTSAAGAQAGHVNSTVSYGTVPYAECKNMAEVRDKILKGYRPIIPSAIGTPGSVKSITGGLTRSPDPILLDILQLGWHPEAHLRPDADFIVEGLTRCWRNSLHSTIIETPFLVDLSRIQEENFKLTVLQDYSAGGNKGFRGSNITMASSFLGASLGPSAQHHQGEGGSGTGSGGAGPGGVGAGPVGSASLSTYSRSQGQQRVVRKPPSPEVIASLLLMKSEAGWSKLEDEGAYLVLTPLRPFFMLWATRKWTQLTGYLVNDVIAYDVCTLLGPKADHLAFEAALEAVGSSGKAEHIMSTIYRRDGKPMLLSVHMFPVFDSSSGGGGGGRGEGHSGHEAGSLTSRDSSYNAYRLSENSVAAASAAVSNTGDLHLPGRVSFSKCADDPGTPGGVLDGAAEVLAGQAPSGGTAPSNSAAATPAKRTPAKYQPYHSSVSRTVHSPIQATDHNHYSAPPTSSSAVKRANSLTQAQQQLQQGMVMHTPERKPSVRGEDGGYDSAGEAERDPSSILERIYSPSVAGLASSALLPRRSTSNVYNINSAGLMTNKGASSVGSLTPAQRSRAPSTVGSVAGDDMSVVEGAMVFDSLVEEDCAHRRVAYIAVQFSSIRDTNV